MIKTSDEKAPDLKHKVVKLSMFSKEHMDKIKDLCTEPYHKERIVVKGKNSDNFLDLKPHSVTKKLMNFLNDEGYQVEIVKSERRTGKKEIAGLAVDVKPLNHSTYDGGVVISSIASGHDDENLNNDVKRITERLLAYFIHNGIPGKRICNESVLGCEYKFY